MLRTKTLIDDKEEERKINQGNFHVLEVRKYRKMKCSWKRPALDKLRHYRHPSGSGVWQWTTKVRAQERGLCNIDI